MEWNPIENVIENIENIEQENYLIALNQQINDHLIDERNYEVYINYLDEPIENEIFLEQINNLIKNFELNNNTILTKYERWNEVPDYIQTNIINIFMIRINNNEININDFRNDEIYYSYLIKMANINYSIEEILKTDDPNGVFITLTLS